MNKDLENACVALETLGKSIINAWGSDATLTEGLGWFGPAITRHELAKLAQDLAKDIRATGAETLESNIQGLVRDVPRRTQLIQSSVVPQMFNGNGGQSVPAYITTISYLRSTLLPPLGWVAVTDNRSLPANLAKRARAAQAELDQLIPNIEGLEKKISAIQEAHAVADNLPLDLQALAEGREKLNRAAIEAATSTEKIKEARQLASEDLEKMNSAYAEAKKLVAQCEEAYQITTTKGLAGAFDQRAGKLAWSMWTWVIGLVIALIVGSVIGAERVKLLSEALSSVDPKWGVISIQAVLSILSVGAPLWFAWLATKQIGQRFRLSEDYAFKASVAKAYEGYRKQAARIDEEFEARLFGSALTRLEEPPLRLVETTTHGSPWHEIANSEALQKAFAAIPELQEKVTSILKDAIAATSKAISAKTAFSKEEPPA